jgi:hypothetical protein
MMDNSKDKGTLQTLAMTQMIKSTNTVKNQQSRRETWHQQPTYIQTPLDKPGLHQREGICDWQDKVGGEEVVR